MRLRLRHQILLPVLVVLLSSVAVVSLLLAWQAATKTQSAFEQQLAGFVRVIAQPRFPLNSAVLRQMRDLSGSEFILADSVGDLLATSGVRLPTGNVGTPLPIGDHPVALGPRVEVDGTPYYHSSLRFEAADTNDPVRELHVLLPAAAYDAAWWGAIVPPLVMGGIAIAATTLITSWVGTRFEHDIRRLGREVQRLATGDFSAVPLPQRDDEVRELAVAIDQTATQLSDYAQQLRETEQARVAGLLGAALAHELRNAATGCRMAIDLHYESCSAVGDDTLDVARGQLTLMESRLQRFMQVGRPPAPAVRTSIDLRDLVADALQLVGPMARHGSVELQWQPPAKSVCGVVDSASCLQAVVNLLLNALDAARSAAANSRHAGFVRIELVRDPSGTSLRVIDSGAGPPADLHERLFQPFVSDKPEGAGLGLMVVAEFADAHGGRVAWSRQQDTTVFDLRLPLTVAE